MEKCCKDKKNFGHPIKLCDWGTITGYIFQPKRDANGVLNRYNLNDFNADTITDALFDTQDVRWYPLPNAVNVQPPTAADSQKEEAANGRTAFLKSGKISNSAEFWDADGTSVLKGKIESMRCDEWNVYFVTSKNKIVGAKEVVAGVAYFKGVAVDAESIDPKFMFKSDTTTQKVMLMFDLDNNFKDSTYYAISGDSIWSTTDETETTIDFNDLARIIDCELVASNASTTSVKLTINDDYRQDTRISGIDVAGNVTGLVAADFVVTNITDDAVVTPSGVTESPEGVYTFTVAAQTSNDKMQIELVPDSTKQISFAGKVVYLIP